MNIVNGSSICPQFSPWALWLPMQFPTLCTVPQDPSFCCLGAGIFSRVQLCTGDGKSALLSCAWVSHWCSNGECEQVWQLGCTAWFHVSTRAPVFQRCLWNAGCEHILGSGFWEGYDSLLKRGCLRRGGGWR